MGCAHGRVVPYALWSWVGRARVACAKGSRWVPSRAVAYASAAVSQLTETSLPPSPSLMVVVPPSFLIGAGLELFLIKGGFCE